MIGGFMPMELPEVMLFFGISLESDPTAKRFAKLRRSRRITARHGRRELSGSIARERDM
jgi:hypothetical protein